MQLKANIGDHYPSQFKNSTDNKNNDPINTNSELNKVERMDKHRDQEFAPAVDNQTKSHSLELDLGFAIERNQLELYYQPKVFAKNNQIIGAEALIRWNHPVLGMISPNDFIPLAEKTGLIKEIGKWVTKTACMQNKAWQDAKLPLIPISVNLSATHFLEKDLITNIVQTLKETSLEPQYLEIEITETSLLEEEEIVFSILEELRNLGIKIALDDFGTGYSSLSYLNRFKGKIDILKIDRSFIHNLSSSHEEDANFIVNMIIQLSHQLKMCVIAEGVETNEQLKVLQNYNCNTIQGYLFSKPLPAEEFTQLLKKSLCEKQT
ncbi:putative bifunctional diguanylate cyclase/phosphodiesterase [Psychrobacillus soli]|uniref:EAL domain-containing protein n=1 Tax=Psychrobacillus soli TaxID=1543965 RepID=A0A544TLF4_9BACI|nr:EAL domain-containing protein [Psychrobacillus soli]TQR18245.1 EAL domain-containing protein [Psychrobacillus soli]